MGGHAPGHVRAYDSALALHVTTAHHALCWALEAVAEAVGGGYCRLQMPLRLTLGVRGTVAGHRLGALERGGGCLCLCLWPSLCSSLYACLSPHGCT